MTIARVSIILLLAGLPSFCFAGRDISGGVQKCYQRRVPHVTAQGKKLYSYDARKSFLPLGVWSIELSKLKELHEAGFNLVCLAGIQRLDLDDSQRRKEMLKRLSDNRIQLITWRPVNEDTIKALKDEKSFMAYMLIDEPNRFVYDKKEPVEQIFYDVCKTKGLIHTIDPERLTYLNLVPLHAFIDYPDRLQESWWHAFNAASEIASTDCYPFTSADCIVDGQARSVKDQVELNQDDTPTWFIAQGHKDKRLAPHPDNVLPTLEQFRAQVYTAIVHGATGIMIFKLNEECWGTHPGIGPDTRVDWGTPEQRAKTASEGMVITEEDAKLSRQLWSLAGEINRELTSLKEAILTPTSPLDYKIILEDSQGGKGVELPIRTLLKKVGDQYYLFASNIDSCKATVRIEMPGTSGKVDGLKVEIEGKPNAARAVGNTIKDVFSPLDVRVYKFKLSK